MKFNWRKFLSNVLIYILILSFSFFITEVVYRNFFYKQKNNEWMQMSMDKAYIPRSYVMGVADPNQLRPSINTLGYRGPLPIIPKPMNELRIIILGGSTVFCGEPYNLTPDKAFSLPWAVEQLLQKNISKNIRVYNFGIGSSVAQQDLVRLTIDLPQYKPDLILFYGGGNDYSNAMPPGIPHRSPIISSNPILQPQLDKYPTFPLLFFGSAILRTIFHDYFENLFFKIPNSPKFYEKSNPAYFSHSENYADSIYKMYVISKAFDSDFLAIFQPMATCHLKSECDDIRKFVTNVQKSIKLKPNGQKLEFITLVESYTKISKNEWLDNLHLKNQGNLKISEIIYNSISKKVLALLKLNTVNKSKLYN